MNLSSLNFWVLRLNKVQNFGVAKFWTSLYKAGDISESINISWRIYIYIYIYVLDQGHLLFYFQKLYMVAVFRSLCFGRLHSGFSNHRELHGAIFSLRQVTDSAKRS